MSEKIHCYSRYPGDAIVEAAVDCHIRVETSDITVEGILYSRDDESISIERRTYDGRRDIIRVLKKDIVKFSYKEESEMIDTASRNHILDTAKSIINGERQGTYGHAEDSFSTIAGLWTAYLKKEINSADVANMMILMKVARNSSGVYKEDNWIDICWYAAIGGEIQGGQIGNDDLKCDEPEYAKDRKRADLESEFDAAFMDIANDPDSYIVSRYDGPFTSHDEAYAHILKMKTYINLNGYCTVADWLRALGFRCGPNDYENGWTNLDDTSVAEINDGYEIVVTKPIKLNKEKESN